MTIAATDNGYCEWMMLFSQSKEEAQAAVESFLLSLLWCNHEDRPFMGEQSSIIGTRPAPELRRFLRYWSGFN